MCSLSGSFWYTCVHWDITLLLVLFCSHKLYVEFETFAYLVHEINFSIFLICRRALYFVGEITNTVQDPIKNPGRGKDNR